MLCCANTVRCGWWRAAQPVPTDWARANGGSANVELMTYPADWGTQGKAAGILRNMKMLAEEVPDLVLAFPGGRGTDDMVRRSQRAGIEVRMPGRAG